MVRYGFKKRVVWLNGGNNTLAFYPPHQKKYGGFINA
ncbi:MAG: hypothetical protein JG764_1040 [Clostridiales bacterium]|jgi:hypothetical protein|nr:hypothetical protein [Clostridiales bacterium]